MLSFAAVLLSYLSLAATKSIITNVSALVNTFFIFFLISSIFCLHFSLFSSVPQSFPIIFQLSFITFLLKMIDIIPQFSIIILVCF